MNLPQPKLSETSFGALLALTSGLIWGAAPLYFRWVGAALPMEIVLHRVLWSVPLLLIAISLTKRWPQVQALLRDARKLRVLCCTAVLIAVNWFVFVYAVSSQQLVEASLGYFINPLFSALLGIVVLGERPRPLGWLALSIAAIGVLNELVQFGSAPWIALALAGSFGTYGLLRKQVGVGSDVGLLVETGVLLPIAIAVLVLLLSTGRSHFGVDVELTVGLMLGSVITIVPLMCFAGAAMRLQLTTLGFFQYLSPSLSLALAIWVFAEPLPLVRALTFASIWLALVVSSMDAMLHHRRMTSAARG